VSGGGFANRVSLCKAWRGLRDDELKKVSGFADISFVHHAGFIGGAWSDETCMKMALASLEEDKAEKDQQKPAAPKEAKEPSIFDQILKKEKPADILFEDDNFIAIKEMNPQAPVHFLVVPKCSNRPTGLSSIKAEQKHILGDLLLTA
jgi:hypothetical protein